MFFTKAPPQRASAVRENGFSFLSWKKKTLLAATVMLCGGGLAAQFPNTATPEERIADSSSVSKPIADENFARFDQEASESDGVTYSQPNRQYADNAAADSPRKAAYSISHPAGPIAKYTPPPKIGDESEIAAPSEPAESLAANKPKVASFPTFDTLDYSSFEKTAIDLPLARWNPLFDKAPPLSEMPSRSQPVTEENKVVAAKPEIRAGETVLEAMIDSSALVPANKQPESTTQEIVLEAMIDSNALVSANRQLENTTQETVLEAMIDTNALVPAQQITTDFVQELNAVIPDEFLVPVGK